MHAVIIVYLFLLCHSAISMDSHSFFLYDMLVDILYSMGHCDPSAPEQCADALLAQDSKCAKALIVKVKVVNEDVDRPAEERQRCVFCFRYAFCVFQKGSSLRATSSATLVTGCLISAVAPLCHSQNTRACLTHSYTIARPQASLHVRARLLVL